MTSDLNYEYVREGLDPKKLVMMAQNKSGLTDFGESGFLTSLDKFVDCVAREARLHAKGLDVLGSEIVDWLVNRLRMHRDIQKNPGILDEDLSDPIIIIGLGRSGTTKLQKMMSSADNVQKALFWRLLNPARFPDAVEGHPDPRIAAATASHTLTADNPEHDAAHRIAEEEVEEEWMLYYQTFEDWIWCAVMYLPTFFDWTMSRSGQEAYRYVKKVLQYLQWQDGGHRDRPWILKAVGHIANIECLLNCYPNATLVHAHRDPRQSIPSFSKLLHASWSVRTDPPPKRVIGAEQLRQWSTATTRYLAARDKLKLDDRILDVKYEQVRSDPMPVIKEVFKRANRHLGAEMEQQMLEWNNNNEQHKFGKHVYSLEEFGLSGEGIDQAFEGYITRFIDR